MRWTFSSVSLLLLLLLSCGRHDERTLTPDAREARRLFAEAGYADGKGFPKLTLIYNTSENHKKIAVAVQAMWRRNLGIEVAVQNLEWKDYIARINAADFDMARGAWLGEYHDPHAFVALMTDMSINRTGWRSAEYDRLVEQSTHETDKAARYALLGRAERILMDEAPIAPLFNNEAKNWMKPFVRGVWHNARDMHPLQGVTLEGPGAPADGVLVYCGGEEPMSLDPAISMDVAGLKILMQLYEGLANYDPRTGEPIPGAAERWDVSEDGRTWTFHLHAATWSNGDPLTAEDFVYAWRRVVDPKTASRYAQRMDVIRGAKAIIADSAAPDTLGVRAPDPRTLVVELEHRVPWLPWLLCLNIFYPVHRATIEKHGDKWVRPENVVSNGPYVLTFERLNDRKEYVKNPRYRAASGVKLERFVTRHPGGNMSTWWTMYDAGQVHWVFNAQVERIAELAKRADCMKGPYNFTYWYNFNTKRKPLDDVRVRRALSLAIDRVELCEKRLQAGETPADRLTPPLYPGYTVP